MIGLVDFIFEDLFGIAGRLREIDSGYFVVYSYRHRRFEVHHSEQKGGSLAFVVPFDRLDARTLTLARQSRRERKAEIIAQMEADNLKREKAQRDLIVKKALVKVEEAYRAI